MKPCLNPAICGVRNHYNGTECRAEAASAQRMPSPGLGAVTSSSRAQASEPEFQIETVSTGHSHSVTDDSFTIDFGAYVAGIKNNQDAELKGSAKIKWVEDVDGDAYHAIDPGDITLESEDDVDDSLRDELLKNIADEIDTIVNDRDFRSPFATFPGPRH